MARKKRSERFAEKNQINRQERKENRGERIKKPKKQVKRKRGKKINIFTLVLLILIILSPLLIYQKFINTPQRTINKAVESIQKLDYEEQEKYFDKLVKVEDVLKESYSTDKKEQEEFLKANFSNLKVDIISQKKTKDGLEVIVDVTNICYVDIYDKLEHKDEDIHKEYVKKLENQNQDKLTTTAKLILDKKFTYYKIYESRDFVNGILGGALKYSDND